MKHIHLSPRIAKQTRPAKEVRRVPATTLSSSEFLLELQSAAGMIMSREECEALVQEVEQLRRAHPVAA